MQTVYLPLQMAPSSLYQPILPNWSFNFLNVNAGVSSNASIEQAVLQNVGSYGKQIGHLAEALEVVIEKLKILDDQSLTKEQKDALKVFLGDVAAVRQLKQERI
ncbi:MAG: hypothetical protein NVV73_13765 [Cellvibrionaceae bacterium]|nr:hypothetical protein [Cellvibrionaceae bacterium]